MIEYDLSMYPTGLSLMCTEGGALEMPLDPYTREV